MLGRTNTGGGSARIRVQNATVLPASGVQNDIVVIGANDVTEVHVSNDVPAEPVENMIWLKCGGKSNCYLIVGNMKIYITSAVQYVNSEWVTLGEWYVHNGTQWVRGRVWIIKDGVLTDFTTLSASNGGTLNTSANPITYAKSSGSDPTSGGVITGQYNYAQFSTVSFRGTWSAGGGSGFSCKYGIHAVGGDLNSAFAVSAASASRTDSTSILTLPITYSDLPCIIRFYSYFQRNGNYGRFSLYDLYLD